MPGVTYKHDCDECVYKGTFPNEKGVQVDFYTCKGSVIARFSGEGPDYVSVPAAVILNAHRVRAEMGTIDSKMLDFAEELEKAATTS